MVDKSHTKYITAVADYFSTVKATEAEAEKLKATASETVLNARSSMVDAFGKIAADFRRDHNMPISGDLAREIAVEGLRKAGTVTEKTEAGKVSPSFSKAVSEVVTVMITLDHHSDAKKIVEAAAAERKAKKLPAKRFHNEMLTTLRKFRDADAGKGDKPTIKEAKAAVTTEVAAHREAEAEREKLKTASVPERLKATVTKHLPDDKWAGVAEVLAALDNVTAKKPTATKTATKASEITKPVSGEINLEELGILPALRSKDPIKAALVEALFKAL